ncbi:hypothetical protein N320_11627, partial [Buceros rhinoceros silvestris]
LCCSSGGATVGFPWKLLLMSLQYLQGREGTLLIWTEQAAADASYCYSFKGSVPIGNLHYQLSAKCKAETH